MLARGLVCGTLTFLAAQGVFADEPTRKDYDCAGAKVVVWTHKDYEEQHVVVWFHDGAGQPTRPNVTAPGMFIPLCTRGAFLLFDNTGAHFMSGKSWMMSAQGDVLGGYDLGQFTVKHGVTGDDALVWVQSFEWDGKISRTRLVAVTAEGVLLHDKLYEAAARVNLSLAGKSYPVDVVTPDLPY